MNIFDVIYGRRSIRKFLDRDIDNKDVKKIIDAANHAPSACDIQGWRFIVVKDKDLKQKIVDVGAASFIKDAPVGILVLYDNRTDNVEYQDYIQSAAASIQNMILAAWSLGIGCCWVCHLPLKRQLRKILSIPENYDPIAYVAMGYFDQEITKVSRKLPVEKLISYDKFGFEFPESPVKNLGMKRFCRRVYYSLPFKKWIKPAIDKKFEKKF